MGANEEEIMHIVMVDQIPDGCVGEHIKGNVKLLAFYTSCGIFGTFLSPGTFLVGDAISIAFLIWTIFTLAAFYDECRDYFRYREWKTK